MIIGFFSLKAMKLWDIHCIIAWFNELLFFKLGIIDNIKYFNNIIYMLYIWHLIHDRNIKSLELNTNHNLVSKHNWMIKQN